MEDKPDLKLRERMAEALGWKNLRLIALGISLSVLVGDSPNGVKGVETPTWDLSLDASQGLLRGVLEFGRGREGGIVKACKHCASSRHKSKDCPIAIKAAAARIGVPLEALWPNIIVAGPEFLEAMAEVRKDRESKLD